MSERIVLRTGESLVAGGPPFTAAEPEVAEPLIERLVAELMALGGRVGTGRFRADMSVELVNDGPVTLHVEV